ncbi:MAG TPA: PGPGW domain-containing protein [Terriglobales bacterium]|nr:PGPGW domain-containing protein [Terriglobales bacterium]
MQPFVRPTRSRWERFLLLTVGWLCMLIGLIGGLIPVIQGWPFGIAGLLILSREYEWAHNLVHRLRTRFPKFGRIMDATTDKTHQIMQKVLKMVGRQAA